MCTLGGPITVQTILHLSPSVLQHCWCVSQAAVILHCSSSASCTIIWYTKSFMHPQRNLKWSNLVTWQAMWWDPVSKSICLKTADQERLSLGASSSKMEPLYIMPTHWRPLTPSDFFLWGYIKDLVYQTKVQDVDKLQSWIVAPSKTYTSDTAKH
jgi:hypothetical protein